MTSYGRSVEDVDGFEQFIELGRGRRVLERRIQRISQRRVKRSHENRVFHARVELNSEHQRLG